MSTFILLLFLDVCQVFVVVIVFDDIDFNISINVNFNVIMSTYNRRLLCQCHLLSLPLGSVGERKNRLEALIRT